ncbi:MAG: histidine phosphatase family protein [Selenomonadaceae bacterium]|nr:histidine phosphatase family protein [Selenomonadaceae bacterium]
MTKIIYIRHGQTEWNISGRYQGQSDVALSPLGTLQAEKLAAHFPVAELSAIYSSTLSRAMRTAECIAERFGLVVQPRAELREINFGDWEGLTYDEITKKWPEALTDFFQHPDRLAIPHGETFPIVQARALGCIRELCQKHTDETIAVVAHGAILRTLLAAALHMDLQYLWTIRQFNTAVSIVCYHEDGTTSVELVNSTAHLGAAQPAGKI